MSAEWDGLTALGKRMLIADYCETVITVAVTGVVVVLAAAAVFCILAMLFKFIEEMFG